MNFFIKSAAFVALLYSSTAFSACDTSNKDIECGIKVFQERCALCHGSFGLGDGVLPLSLKQYPNTNLLKQNQQRTQSQDDIKQVVALGSLHPDISAEMPSWKDELSPFEINAVAELIFQLRTKTPQTVSLLRAREQAHIPSQQLGQTLFAGRCTLCHGKKADGKGRMAKIIKNPPPFNLTLSRAPDAYLKNIISKGGQAMGRSSRMPPWGKDLNSTEIDSIILFLKSIRS
ncbi:MAG: c-type cytochrome [Gammaproteobacteria bacterium]|nr:c-type cytochrome [Gammaproteobacteria bacterium]